MLAGKASAALTFALGTPASFDCRISQLPTERDVDYFRWRADDATRNALAGHCYWLLRKQGLDEREATNRLNGASIAERNELLFANGFNFIALPTWQRRGIGVSWGDRTTCASTPDHSTRRGGRRLIKRNALRVADDSKSALSRPRPSREWVPSRNVHGLNLEPKPAVFFKHANAEREIALS